MGPPVRHEKRRLRRIISVSVQLLSGIRPSSVLHLPIEHRVSSEERSPLRSVGVRPELLSDDFVVRHPELFSGRSGRLVIVLDKIRIQAGRSAVRSKFSTLQSGCCNNCKVRKADKYWNGNNNTQHIVTLKQQQHKTTNKNILQTCNLLRANTATTNYQIW